jgi:hypothetical protein
MSAEAMADLMAMHDEPLLPELAEWLRESESFGQVLKHPLVNQIIVIPGLANRTLLAKQEALAEAEDAEDWHAAVFLHERPYRCDALVDYVVGRGEADEVLSLAGTSQETRDLAADVWVDSENIHQYMEEWTAMFAGEPLWLGTEAERAAFDALPDPITAWRGDIDDGGWSHTTDEKIATFFATRFGAAHEIVKVSIPKSQVFGYLTRRGESELLVRRDA